MNTLKQSDTVRNKRIGKQIVEKYESLKSDIINYIQVLFLRTKTLNN